MCLFGTPVDKDGVWNQHKFSKVGLNIHYDHSHANKKHPSNFFLSLRHERNLYLPR